MQVFQYLFDALGKPLFTQVQLVQNRRQLSVQVIESLQFAFIVRSHIQRMSAATMMQHGHTHNHSRSN